VLSARGEQTSAAPAMLLLITPADGAVTIPAALIQPTFGLSPAEARLVSALVAGRTLAEIADDTALSRNTLRNQLAAVFAKTGTSRQTELVAVVVRALGAMAGPARRGGQC
jgi:DNA-binding CsgD family transcriptional regulator